MMWGTYRHRKRSFHIPPNTSLHYLHPSIRIHIIDRFGTLKRGFGGGWRILDLLSGSHRSYARYTRVYGLLFISRHYTCEGKVNEERDVQAKARSYSNIHLSIASSTNTKSTSVKVWAICLNFGLNPFRAAKILLRLSGDILLPLGLGV
jgi:hypothetical protein